VEALILLVQPVFGCPELWNTLIQSILVRKILRRDIIGKKQKKNLPFIFYIFPNRGRKVKNKNIRQCRRFVLDQQMKGVNRF
jgi:hypothetical protein